MKTKPSMFIDTSVWLNRYLNDSPEYGITASLFSFAQSHELILYYSVPSIKDVFYIYRQRTKRLLAAAGISATEDISHSIDDTAWSIVSDIRRIGVLAVLDSIDLDYAEGIRQVHNDFEDDLILAASKRVDADFLVTSDRKLRNHSTVATFDPDAMLAYLKSSY